jgi:hypothetical protein
MLLKVFASDETEHEYNMFLQILVIAHQTLLLSLRVRQNERT